MKINEVVNNTPTPVNEGLPALAGWGAVALVVVEVAFLTWTVADMYEIFDRNGYPWPFTDEWDNMPESDQQIIILEIVFIALATFGGPIAKRVLPQRAKDWIKEKAWNHLWKPWIRKNRAEIINAAKSSKPQSAPSNWKETLKQDAIDKLKASPIGVPAGYEVSKRLRSGPDDNYDDVEAYLRSISADN